MHVDAPTPIYSLLPYALIATLFSSARCFGQALALLCLITRWPALLAKLFFFDDGAAGEAQHG
jgi:hypothetical protein